MKTQPTPARGAFGATQITLTPQSARALLFDITNCPHCGTHHASVSAEVDREQQRIVVRCPSLGGAPLTMTVKMFLHRL
jgi:transcription elongation factor Elf1